MTQAEFSGTMPLTDRQRFDEAALGRWLHEHFGESPAHATFPSPLPLLALDRIWSSPASLLRRVRVHRSRLARRASDHLPLVARLAWDSD